MLSTFCNCNQNIHHEHNIPSLLINTISKQQNHQHSLSVLYVVDGNVDQETVIRQLCVTSNKRSPTKSLYIPTRKYRRAENFGNIQNENIRTQDEAGIMLLNFIYRKSLSFRNVIQFISSTFWCVCVCNMRSNNQFKSLK